MSSAIARYRDPNVAVADRVEDLLTEMTVAEKAAQLGSAWVFQVAEGVQLDIARANAVLADGIGQITRVSGASNLTSVEAASLANAIQAYLAHHTRLGIPAIIHEEICSGLMSRQATIFPQAIGLASTWEPELAVAIGDAVREQMRAMGAHQGLAPVLDVCRDPRWGRTEETFGEDPHLVSSMGVAFIRGLQGDDRASGVVATAKHFVGYGASEGGLNWAPAHVGERELRDVYLRPFEAAVRFGGVGAVMHAYNEIDGIPCGANRRLLTTILRDEWGFDGFVVSDYFAIRQLADYHRVAADTTEAAAVALDAGIDVELPGTDCFGAPLLDAVASGRVDMSAVDAAVRRVLRTKFELGLFEQPFVDPEHTRAVSDPPAHRALAVEIAAKSLVLLSNDGILPLAPSPGAIAVIGPNAANARHLLGDYTYPAHIESLLEVLRNGDNVFAMPIDPAIAVALDSHDRDIPTVLDGMRARFGERVRYAPGCGITSTTRQGFADAVALAAESDVAVLVLGDKAGLTDDCTSGETRDVTSLELPGVQEDLARAVIATGTPVVLVLVAGRPVGSEWLHEHCAAVIDAWFPGQEGAAAIAAVLAGDVDPGGRLPISFPRTSGQIPVYYGHKVSGGRSHWKGDYVDRPATPMYPFGHGLSYTTFERVSADLLTSVVAAGDRFGVRVVTVNTGDRDGSDVVQLYARVPAATVTRPVLELVGFRRVELAAGESATVTFAVPVAMLGFYDRRGVFVVESGPVDVFVGRSAADLRAVGTFVVVDGDGDVPLRRPFDASADVDREGVVRP